MPDMCSAYAEGAESAEGADVSDWQAYPRCVKCEEDLIPQDGELCGACAQDLRDRITKLELALRACGNLTRHQHEEPKTVRAIGERVQVIVRELLDASYPRANAPRES